MNYLSLCRFCFLLLFNLTKILRSFIDGVNDTIDSVLCIYDTVLGRCKENVFWNKCAVSACALRTCALSPGLVLGYTACLEKCLISLEEK
jgi:hypothetical protein